MMEFKKETIKIQKIAEIRLKISENRLKKKQRSTEEEEIKKVKANLPEENRRRRSDE